ncbi:MAG: hypothetical protein KGJ43_03315 [Acidobacteriota bacterium]|nr:hypothetical protein [Acidobacteriota bacterium]
MLHAGRQETFQVRQAAPGQLVVSAWGVSAETHETGRRRKPRRKRHGRRRHRARRASVARVAAVPLPQLLAQIAEGAQGGAPVAVPMANVQRPVAAVALHPFTNLDGSASAEVPVGFQCGGTRGFVECLDPHGSIEFGIGMPVCVPGSAKAETAETIPGESALCPGIAPFIESASTAVTTLWGPVLDKLTNAGIANVALVKSAPAVSSPGWNASFNVLTFTRNGAPWTAAIYAATTPNTGSFEEWLFYYSAITVPQSDNSSYGQALAKSWETFNPSAAEHQRLQEANNNVHATTEEIQEVTAFRQQVGEEGAEHWDEYIRGSELP